MENDLDQPLEKEADRLEEDCTYSAKGHYESARLWGRWNLGLGIPSTLLAALAGVSAFKNLPELAAALAIFSAAITAVLTFLKPSERASTHLKAGALYNSLKNRARFFKELELNGNSTPDALVKKLRQLSEDRNSLNESSPEILRPAFQRARRGIESGESTYRADNRKPE